MAHPIEQLEPITPDAMIQCSNDALMQRSIRDEKGRILPGTVLNPSGRPKTRFISEALRDGLEAGDAQVLAKKWLNIAKKGKPGIAHAAISAIADRTEGKPTQQVKLEQSLDENTVKRIAELSARLLDVNNVI